MERLKTLGDEYSKPLSWKEKREVAHEIISGLTVIPPVDISKALVIFVGIPGSGKSAASDFLRDKYGFNAIATDKIKSFLLDANKNFVKPDLFYIQSMVFRYLFENSVNVASDSNSNISKYRYRLKKMGESYKYNIATIHIVCDPEVCLQRVIARDNVTEEELIERWRQKIYRDRAETQTPKNAINIDGNQGFDRVRSDLVAVFERLIKSYN